MDIKKELPGVKGNVLLKDYTTFKIGGKAKYFFVAKNKEDLIKAISVAKKFHPVRDYRDNKKAQRKQISNGVKLPFFVLGGGSNLLVSDKGCNGLVIKVKSQKSKVKKNQIFCEAGVPLARLVQISIKKNLTGLEWGVGIPGTVGGAIAGNAGAFKKSIGDSVIKVEVYDPKDNKIKIFKKINCKFGYRDSVFKEKKNQSTKQSFVLGRAHKIMCSDLVILSAIIQLKKGKKSEIKRKIKEFLDYRQETQPLNFPSAGSVFKNVKFANLHKFTSNIANKKIREICGKFGDIREIPAGWLIERCNLKGKKIGKAKISEKHANFILNLGGAKARDIKKLINLIKKKVKEKFGITLEEEIQYLF